jgi:hypothetical protein
VESTCGAIELTVEHCKQGDHGRRVSTSACLRGWKHKMKCNNENWYGKFFFFILPCLDAPECCTPGCHVYAHDTLCLE